MSWIENFDNEIFGSFNLSELLMDQAWLNVSSIVNVPLYLYELSANCHKCPYRFKGAISKENLNKFIVSSTYPMKYRLRTDESKTFASQFNDSAKFCDVDFDFGEFGVYDLHALGSIGSPRCEKYIALEPVNIYLPLLLAFFFYILLGIIVFVVSKNKWKILAFFDTEKFGSKRNLTTSSGSSGHGQGNKSPETPSGPGPGPHQSIYNLPRRTSDGSVLPSHSQLQNNQENDDIHVLSSTTQESNNSSPTSSGNSQSGNGVVHRQIFSPLTKKASGDSTASIPRPISSPQISTIGQGPNPRGLQLNLQNHQTTSPNVQDQKPPRQMNKRLRSLDTFRGISIVTMIFVNDGGAGYHFFQHATWDGLDVADLVFPWFLWIMGVCIPVSIKSQVKRGNSRFAIFWRIFYRSLKLIGLGLILGSGYGPVNFDAYRLPGVLQRFGLSYFIASSLVLFCMTVNITKPDTSKFKAAVQDIGIIWLSWIIVLLIVALHCILTFMLEVPGCPTGYIGPGGMHLFEEMKNESYPFPDNGTCIGGAAGYIDRQIFSVKHIYNYPTAKTVYGAKAYDPEGMLGNLNAILNVWFGIQAGATMLVYPRASSRLKRWIGWGIITGALGALLCNGQRYDGWIPVNKNLWSLSFVLVTTCFALTLLSILYVIIDIKKWWSGSPFYEPGMNSILLYVGHSVARSYLPWHWTSDGFKYRHFPRLVESLWGTSLWVLIAIWLHYKKLYWIL